MTARAREIGLGGWQQELRGAYACEEIAYRPDHLGIGIIHQR